MHGESTSCWPLCRLILNSLPMLDGFKICYVSHDTVITLHCVLFAIALAMIVVCMIHAEWSLHGGGWYHTLKLDLSLSRHQKHIEQQEVAVLH